MGLTYTAGKPGNREFTVPAGEYDLKVIEAKEDTSKSGNDMIKLSLQIVHDDGRDGPKIFDYLVLTTDASWKIDQFLAACGHPPEEGQPVDLDVDAMIGWECRANLIVDEYDGKNGKQKNNKVESYVIDGGF